jgi:hypothetical protein
VQQDDWINSCDEEPEVDMWANLVSSTTVLVGTFVLRYALNTYIGPWYIAFKVRAVTYH